MKLLLINFILWVIAVLLELILTPIGIIYSLYYFLFNKRGVEGLAKYLLKMAISKDQSGNVSLQFILNKFLIKKGGHKFGDEDETISSVIGKNVLTCTLTKLGTFLNSFLNILEKNHSINSIE